MDSSLYRRRLQQFKQEVSLYPVSCEKLCNGRSDKQWLDDVLAGGAKIVQLRDKLSDDGVLLEKARYFRKRTKEAQALFLINDRLDIALLSDADGIHVGTKDIPPVDIRKLCPDILIGQSCNSEEQAQVLGNNVIAGENVLSYYNIGPLYSTKTKDGLQSFLGPDVIQRFSALCPLPFTVMGGIKLDHVEELVEAGARRLAVVTAISQADDMTSETQKWIRRIRAASSNQKSIVR